MNTHKQNQKFTWTSLTQSLRSWACCAVFRDHGYTPTILNSLKDRLCPTYSMTHSVPLSLLKLTQEKESSQQNQVCLLPYMWSCYFIIWELCFRSTKQPKGLFSPFYIVCLLKIVSGLELLFFPWWFHNSQEELQCLGRSTRMPQGR